MAENSFPTDHSNRIPPTATAATGRDVAADVIRDKVSRLYANEPAARQELAEAEAVQRRSKHQQFMHQLSNSGQDLAAIQTAWHDYYQGLPSTEKHQVWQEFYESQSVVTGQSGFQLSDPQTLAKHKHQATTSDRSKVLPAARKLREARSRTDIQATIRQKVTAGGRLQTKHHVQSLLFGLGMGGIVVVIFLFGFFNEVIIAPFIQPSRVAAATPLIVTTNSLAASATPEVIIPKINVEIPVNYGETSTNEATIENDLESGIVHYPTTALPGQAGNTAFFGHSSNNIFNKGKYKFAFVLLHTLIPGDTFYLTYSSKVFVYKVITRSVVEPTDVSVLGPVSGQTATATLITCDPPGTSLHRLVIVGQQISPDPAGNTAATDTATLAATPTQLPGNGPTLWHRFTNTFLGKTSLVVVLIAGFVWTMRWVNQPNRNRKGNR